MLRSRERLAPKQLGKLPRFNQLSVLMGYHVLKLRSRVIAARFIDPGTQLCEKPSF
jgi:hypothetical protein